MDCGPLREDIEAYTVGALDPASARRLQAHTRDCAACRNLVRVYALAADEIALSIPIFKAPARLKERVLGGVGAFRPNVTPALLVRSSKWWAAAALVFLAFGIGAVGWAFSLSSQVNDLPKDKAAVGDVEQGDAAQRTVLIQMQADLNAARAQQRLTEQTLLDYATLIGLAFEGDDLIPTELAGTSTAPGAQCRYVWSTKQSLGGLFCHKLGQVSFALTYQLWAVRGDRVVSFGTFSPRPDGSALLLYKSSSDVNPITNMFVTLETSSQTARQPSVEVMLERTVSQQAAR